ncbi:hypothetical protein Tco_0665466 [Tanacetum coccineum]
MSSYNHFCCSYCGGPFNGGNCPSCSSVGSGDEFVYDPNPYSYNETPNFFNQPPQYQYETYSCEFCGGNSHPGFDCQTGNTPVFDQGPCYNQDFRFNQPLHYFLSQQQQFPYENCRDLHENFQYQPINQDFYNSNSSGFDHFQPPQFPDIHQNPQETSKEILQAREDLMEAIQAFLKEYDHIPPNEKCMALLLAKERFLKIKQTMEEDQNQPEVMQELLLKLMNDLQILKGSQPEKKETAAQGSLVVYLFGVTPKVILIAWECFGKIKDALMDKQYQREDIQELMSKLLEDVRNISEEFSKYINCPSWNRPLFYFDDDDDEYTVIWRRPKPITPDKPSEEPEEPLIMGEEELSTISEKDKSNVEDLVLIPSGSKGFSDDICDNDHFDVESLLSQDIPITSPKIYFLSEEFADELAPIPPGMDEDEFDKEEDDCYDDDTLSDDDSFGNIDYVEVSPLDFELVSLEEVEDVILRGKLSNVYHLISKIEALNDNPTLSSFSYSDNSFSDHMEETRSGSTTTHADISLSEYDSFLFEIVPDQEGLIGIDNSNDSLLEIPEFESFYFNDPSFRRPPPEPLDVEICLNFEPDTPVINNFVELNEDECFDPGGGEIVLSPNVEDDDSFTFFIRIFLPFLTYPVDSPLLLSTRSEDTIFDPVIFT